MARRARKLLLLQLIWGPQKRSYRRTSQVTVVRIQAHSITMQQTVEDFALVAAGVALGAILPLLITGGIA